VLIAHPESAAAGLERLREDVITIFSAAGPSSSGRRRR
jgi:hypothetical protein